MLIPLGQSWELSPVVRNQLHETGVGLECLILLLCSKFFVTPEKDNVFPPFLDSNDCFILMQLLRDTQLVVPLFLPTKHTTHALPTGRASS